MSTNIEQVQAFLRNNEDAFKKLGKRIKEATNIDGVESIEELKGRQIAKKIIVDWLNDLWYISSIEELPQEEDTESIFKTLDKRPEREF